MNFLTPIIKKFYCLQWKLTFFYILITIVVLLVLESLFILGAFGLVHYQKNIILGKQVSVIAKRLGTYFHGSSIDQSKMMQTLKNWPMEMGTEFKGFSTVFDSKDHNIIPSMENIYMELGFQGYQFVYEDTYKQYLF